MLARPASLNAALNLWRRRKTWPGFQPQTGQKLSRGWPGAMRSFIYASRDFLRALDALNQAKEKAKRPIRLCLAILFALEDSFGGTKYARLTSSDTRLIKEYKKRSQNRGTH
ncbi:hypothetical protein KFL_001850170 [Klebsormidium nitens]|uniref:Uncharacterized protein n=1 Tax=Klebsormidium nitens TaxID=105231 RepID=A0A1Y1I304_KLENI|nr:hypothetical protein KFL_001850170 [Klebsormidium nitens]|eukprot:GAQ84342.1 hypothetical protein KFL_001850170 [Klebsormidium nitens]